MGARSSVDESDWDVFVVVREHRAASFECGPGRRAVELTLDEMRDQQENLYSLAGSKPPQSSTRRARSRRTCGMPSLSTGVGRLYADGYVNS